MMLKAQLIRSQNRILWLLLWVSLCLLAACRSSSTSVPQPKSGEIPFVVSSPQPESQLSGTVWFAVQPLNNKRISSVSFRVNGSELARDDDARDGFKTFLNSKDFPAGTLEFSVVLTDKTGKIAEQTFSVTNVPDPPSSGTVRGEGSSFATAAGSVITLPPSAEGAVVTVSERSEAQVEADTGINYPRLGLTFLGAQQVESSEPLGEVGILSADFGPRVQPGQAVVQFGILPDADGDGTGELVVLNSATVTPDGDILSDPVAQVLVDTGDSAVRQTGLSSQQIPRPGISAAPGERVAFTVTGFSPAAYLSNVATFSSSVDGSKKTTIGQISPDFENPGQQVFYALVPLLPAGEALVQLENTVTRSSSFVYINILPPRSLSGDPVDIITGSLEDTAEAIENLPTDTPEEEANLDAVVDNLANASELFETLAENQTPGTNSALENAAQLVDGVGVPNIAPDEERVDLPDLESLRELLRRQQALLGDEVVDLINQPSNGIGEPGDEAAWAYIYDFHENIKDLELHIFAIETVLDIDMGDADVEDAGNGSYLDDTPPMPPAPGGSGLGGGPGGILTGAGAAPVPGGNGYGYAGGDDSSNAAGLSTQQLRPDRTGRYLVKVEVSGRTLPFSGISGADGYFFLPLIPAGQPFVATALDTLTGETQTSRGVGPAAGDSVGMFFNFSSATSAGGCTAKAGYTKTWSGFISSDWFNPNNWLPVGVPTQTDDVYICAAAKNQAALAGSVSAVAAEVRNLLVESGAALRGNNNRRLHVYGDLNVAGELSARLTLWGDGVTLQGRVNTPGLTLRGAASLAGETRVAGTFRVEGGSSGLPVASLAVAGQRLRVAGTLEFSQFAHLNMTDTNDYVLVEGDAAFNLQDSRGLLTAGTLEVKGDLSTGAGSRDGFATSGTHRVVLSGTAQTVSLLFPGEVAGDSNHHFNELVVRGSSVTFVTSRFGIAYVKNDLVLEGGAAILGELTVAGALRTEAGTRVAPELLRLGGSVTGGGSFSAVTTEFFGADQTVPALEYRNLLVTGSARLAADTTLQGNLEIRGEGLAAVASLDLAGRRLMVAGDFDLPQFGTFRMTSATSYLRVDGDTALSPEDSSSLLTDGVMELKGDFETGARSRQGFATSGEHLVVLSSNAAQAVNLRFPAASEHRFNDLRITNQAGVTFASNADVLGRLELTGNMTIPASITVTVGGELGLEVGSVLTNDGTLSVGSCSNNGGAVIGAGNNPCP